MVDGCYHRFLSHSCWDAYPQYPRLFHRGTSIILCGSVHNDHHRVDGLVDCLFGCPCSADRRVCFSKFRYLRSCGISSRRRNAQFQLFWWDSRNLRWFGKYSSIVPRRKRTAPNVDTCQQVTKPGYKARLARFLRMESLPSVPK